jgi:3-dehydroquinate dehydratase / shikimate dehydrogenase
MPTLLCVPILVDDPDAALRDAAAARDAGADLVEFRIDQFFSGSGAAEADSGFEYEARQVLRIVADSPLPCIITCRPVSEGGHYDGDDEARIALFERLGTAFGPGERPPRYLDVELATYMRSANIRQKVNLAIEHPEQLRDVRTSLILSLHDFAGRPADLSRRLLHLRQESAAKVVKVAYRARSLRDNIELFEILAHRDRPTIALAMGEFGLMSRVLAPKFGGFLTFAGLREQSATAPGQPTISELLGLYRFRSLGERTRVYGVIGYPLGHSLSPHVHNGGFEALGHDGVYLPLPVIGAAEGAGGYESLKATLGELIDYAPLHFAGASITIPHKENLLRLARELGWDIEPPASEIGAANTLAIERDESSSAIRRITVSNTDAPALLGALREVAGDPAGKRIAILGAGGGGRAAACILAGAGAQVTIFNRTLARARDLAAELADLGPGRISAAELDSFAAASYDIYINCTPLGMRGGPDPGASPLSLESLGSAPPDAVVMDTVYNPLVTPLLRKASTAGLRTVDGAAMFVRQAALQFSAWTGRPAPAGLFERIVREQLGG